VIHALLAVLLLATPRADAVPEPGLDLVVNGDFEEGEVPPSERGKRYPVQVPVGWERPDGHRVRWAKGLGVDGSRGICFEMDEKTAYVYGQGYFSDPIPVETDTEYEIRVDVASDAPNAIIFVKGFAEVQGPGGDNDVRYREVYSHHKEAHFERYLKEYTGTGRFATQRFTFRPRHPSFQVKYVKIWLYGYLKPGKLFFDNVRMVRVGKAAPETPPQKPEKPPAPEPSAPEAGPNAPIYVDPITITR